MYVHVFNTIDLLQIASREYYMEKRSDELFWFINRIIKALDNKIGKIVKNIHRIAWTNQSIFRGDQTKRRLLKDPCLLRVFS